MARLLAPILALLAGVSQATLYIDLKINFICDGIVVHHGSFHHRGRYKMFIGEREPLSRVNFGNLRLFPTRKDWPEKASYQLIAELFENGIRRFLLLHKYSFMNSHYTGYERIFFELGVDAFIRISIESFLAMINSKVNLSMDIGPTHRHPFIMRTVHDLTTEKKVVYTIVEDFNGVKLDGVQGPLYTFGTVYDSSAHTVVGYSRMDILHKSCSEVTVEYRLTAEKVLIRSGDFTIIYERRLIFNKPIWYMVTRPEPRLVREHVNQALYVYDRIERNTEKYVLITLDVSERISPDLYGLEKTVGVLGEWTYALYQVKPDYEKDHAIRSIIDMSTELIRIHCIEKQGIQTAVEMFVGPEEVIVVVTSFIKSGLTVRKEVEVFGRNRDNYLGFTRVPEPRRSELIAGFEKLYPIRISVSLTDEPSSIYGRKEVGSGGDSLFHYFLKDSDQNGNDLRTKYVIGSIWERNPYVAGNIPSEVLSKGRRLVSDRLTARKFILRNTYAGVPVDPSVYEIYPLMV